jgi:hypothetical protein
MLAPARLGQPKPRRTVMLAPIRSRAFRLMLCLLSSLALAHTAAAQARVEEKVDVTVTGEIVAVDATSSRIVVKSTGDNGVAYDVAATATIMSDADKLALGDLRAGWSVVLNGHRSATGNPVATYIKVVKRPTP